MFWREERYNNGNTCNKCRITTWQEERQGNTGVHAEFDHDALGDPRNGQWNGISNQTSNSAYTKDDHHPLDDPWNDSWFRNRNNMHYSKGKQKDAMVEGTVVDAIVGDPVGAIVERTVVAMAEQLCKASGWLLCKHCRYIQVWCWRHLEIRDTCMPCTDMSLKISYADLLAARNAVSALLSNTCLFRLLERLLLGATNSRCCYHRCGLFSVVLRCVHGLPL